MSVKEKLWKIIAAQESILERVRQVRAGEFDHRTPLGSFHRTQLVPPPPLLVSSTGSHRLSVDGSPTTRQSSGSPLPSTPHGSPQLPQNASASDTIDSEYHIQDTPPHSGAAAAASSSSAAYNAAAPPIRFSFGGVASTATAGGGKSPTILKVRSAASRPASAAIAPVVMSQVLHQLGKLALAQEEGDGGAADVGRASSSPKPSVLSPDGTASAANAAGGAIQMRLFTGPWAPHYRAPGSKSPKLGSARRHSHHGGGGGGGGGVGNSAAAAGGSVRRSSFTIGAAGTPGRAVAAEGASGNASAVLSPKGGTPTVPPAPGSEKVAVGLRPRRSGKLPTSARKQPTSARRENGAMVIGKRRLAGRSGAHGGGAWDLEKRMEELENIRNLNAEAAKIHAQQQDRMRKSGSRGTTGGVSTAEASPNTSMERVGPFAAAATPAPRIATTAPRAASGSPMGPTFVFRTVTNGRVIGGVAPTHAGRRMIGTAPNGGSTGYNSRLPTASAPVPTRKAVDPAVATTAATAAASKHAISSTNGFRSVKPLPASPSSSPAKAPAKVPVGAGPALLPRHQQHVDPHRSAPPPKSATVAAALPPRTKAGAPAPVALGASRTASNLNTSSSSIAAPAPASTSVKKKVSAYASPPPPARRGTTGQFLSNPNTRFARSNTIAATSTTSDASSATAAAAKKSDAPWIGVGNVADSRLNTAEKRVPLSRPTAPATNSASTTTIVATASTPIVIPKLALGNPAAMARLARKNSI